MIINAPTGKKRSEFLIEKYLELIKKGVNTDEILVLVQNSRKKYLFIEEIKKRLPTGNIGSLNVYSFFGLCYNWVNNNWAVVENSINSDNPKIIPNLCGLEISQYIFKQCLESIPFVGYNSKTSLLHQLLRRNSLIIQNNLTKDEVLNRSKILQESYTLEANKTINKYKKETIDYRAFDYLRQVNLFEFLYKKLPNPYKYVFLDDGDEITPAQLAYLEYIKPTVQEFFIAYDEFGSSRLGYLGAINVDFEKFTGEKALFEDKNRAKFVFDSIKNNKPVESDNIHLKTFLKRNEMIENTIFEIKSLINKGIKPNEISIITPISDDLLKTYLDKTGYKFNFLTKSEKLNENQIIGYTLELLKIINDTKNLDVSSYILKGIFIELLNLNKKESIKMIQEYKLERDFKGSNILDYIKNKNTPTFKLLIEIYEKIRFKKLTEQMLEIISNFTKLSRKNYKDAIKINQLLKQIYDFEEVFRHKVDNLTLINQLENTIISENPLSDDEIDEDSIIISTAQKIIDYSYKTRYCFMLDINNENWLRQDIGPMYNAWVMQKNWNKETFDVLDNIELTLDRTARTLYKLFLLSDNFLLFSSVYDSLGLENLGGIDKFFKFKNDITKTPSNPITPRPDQKEVLNYKGGLMSVSATAGSGKTTIMLLLVDKILNGEILSDIDSSNIFVLTFMESAARNFRERIKAKYPNLAELPSISTIHGLALRIIKENNNFSKIGLDYDFEIIDEIKRAAILNQIVYEAGVAPDKADLYDKAISTYKNELSIYGDFNCSNRLFERIYQSYQQKLKEQNLIDYDDLLLLSLKLLRENKDVLDYYQDKVKIVIEDEAQDSSFTQQKLIMLLAGKYKNIIRCGDINQAITSTFSNSDVKGFKEFMKKSKNVVMDRCQRCATGVLDAANNTVKIAQDKKVEAFSSLIMKPVDGVNIIDKNAYSVIDFESEKEETTFIINEINEILKRDNKATIAVLVRSNFAIDKWNNILKENSIKTYKNSDNLINNPVYKICLLILEFITDPYDIKKVREIARILFEAGVYNYEDYDYTLKLNEPIFFNDDYDYQIWWDLNYFLFKNHYSIYNLVYEIGSFYFANSPQAININLIATIAKKIQLTQKTFEDTVKKLREIQYKNNFSNIKFFSFEDSTQKEARVQIMTLHKSKGDEFDYVFIPELTRDNLNLNIETQTLKENTKFCEIVKKNKKTELELKKDIVEENYRLIYVGITRAKKKLYLTTASEYKYFSRVKKFDKSQIIEGLKDEKN